jgi:hypothetical protein
MKREYDNKEINENVSDFVGIEVERTPCFGMKTYFVVGVPKDTPVNFVNKVIKYDVEQVYFGANHSFKNWKDKWTDPMFDLIKECLNAKLHVTVDVDPVTVPPGIKQFLSNSKFSLTYAIVVPSIDKVKGTINIKLDDEGFEATNPGVWSTTIETIKVPNNYTGWDEYKKDKPL